MGTARGHTIGVLWEGSFFVRHSLALVNRELTRALLESGCVDLGLIPYEPDQFTPLRNDRFYDLKRREGYRPPHVDYWVRHRWPPSFDPVKGKLVLIQPWEYGSIPAGWIKPVRDVVWQVWVPSNFVRASFVQSGIDPEKVVVVPNGINPQVFTPEGEVYPLETRHAFRFLFVGGTIFRKGADVLLKAYLAEFTRKDDVCLVIKDFGTSSFYRGQGLGDQIAKLAANPQVPEIVYLIEDLAEDQIPALYRSCHCLVHPYRGEGYGLPIAEAMACGLPVIVTGFGACLDFCNDDNAYLVDHNVVVAHEKRVGKIDLVGYPYWAEPDVEHLRFLMRHVYEHYTTAKAKGEKASAMLRTHHTWQRAAQKIMNQLGAGPDDEKLLVAREDSAAVEQRAVTAFREKRYAEAAAWFNAVLSLKPKDKDVLYNLALAQAEAGNMLDASCSVLKVLQHNPDDGEAWALVAETLLALGDTGSAQRAFKTAQRLGAVGEEARGTFEAAALAVTPQITNIWQHGYFAEEVGKLIARTSSTSRFGDR